MMTWIHGNAFLITGPYPVYLLIHLSAIGAKVPGIFLHIWPLQCLHCLFVHANEDTLSRWVQPNVQKTSTRTCVLDRKCCNFYTVFIISCAEICHFKYFRCIPLWKYHQNDPISVPVLFRCDVCNNTVLNRPILFRVTWLSLERVWLPKRP